MTGHQMALLQHSICCDLVPLKMRERESVCVCRGNLPMALRKKLKVIDDMELEGKREKQIASFSDVNQA